MNASLFFFPVDVRWGSNVMPEPEEGRERKIEKGGEGGEIKRRSKRRGRQPLSYLPSRKHLTSLPPSLPSFLLWREPIWSVEREREGQLPLLLASLPLSLPCLLDMATDCSEKEDEEDGYMVIKDPFTLGFA